MTEAVGKSENRRAEDKDDESSQHGNNMVDRGIHTNSNIQKEERSNKSAKLIRGKEVKVLADENIYLPVKGMKISRRLKQTKEK